jgi:hypothetical protein
MVVRNVQNTAMFKFWVLTQKGFGAMWGWGKSEHDTWSIGVAVGRERHLSRGLVPHLAAICNRARSFSFFLSSAFIVALGPPASYLSVLFFFSRREKQPGREADYLPPSSSEGKFEWCCTFTFNYRSCWRELGLLQLYLPVLFLTLRDSCTVITMVSVRRGEIILDDLCMGDRDRQTCRLPVKKVAMSTLWIVPNWHFSTTWVRFLSVLFSSVVKANARV